MIRFVALILILAITACTPLQPGGVHRSAVTGIDGAISAQQVVSDHRHYVMIGRVLILRQDGQVTLLAEVGQAYNSGQDRLRMRSAYRDGHRLRFRGVRRHEPMCIGNTNCTGARTGTFTFTPDAFQTALQQGFRAHLLGPDGRVEVVFPAEMFVEAAHNAHAVGLLSAP